MKIKSNLKAKALDVWLRFESDNDEEPTHEANTLKDGDEYVVEWYHTAVGQVRKNRFNTLEEAHAWLKREGFTDYSS